MEGDKSLNQKPIAEVSVLLCDSHQIFAHPSQSLHSSQKLCPVFLLGTENMLWGIGVGIVVMVCGKKFGCGKMCGNKIVGLHYGRLGVLGILDHCNLIYAN